MVYVFSSRKTYHLPRERIRSLLYPLLTVRGLQRPQRKVYLAALDLFVTYSMFDFEDALTVAHMHRKNVAQVASYDSVFDRVAGIKRIEP